MWKFCGNAQVLQSVGQFVWKSVQTFSQNLHTRKIGEITVLHAVIKDLESYSNSDIWNIKTKVKVMRISVLHISQFSDTILFFYHRKKSCAKNEALASRK